MEAVVGDISGLTMVYAEQTSSAKIEDEPKTALVDLVDTIESVTRTKVLEFGSSHRLVRIEITNECKGPIFIEASKVELRSIFSNMLNNAVDAGASLINIEIQRTGDVAKILIADSGSGVEPTIKSQLFEKNVSFGKENGTGYGLYHAKKFVSMWKGRIELKETSPSGSTFEIALPLVQFPEIVIEPHHQVVILEDNECERVRLRTQLLLRFGKNLKAPIEFKRTADALDWFESTALPVADIRLFADNDLGAGQKTGLDLISTLGIAGISYLVTNSYGDQELYKKAKVQGIKMLPKSRVLSN